MTILQKGTKEYQELLTFVPEIEEASIEELNLIYASVQKAFPSDDEKLYRYYYLGYILTSDVDSLNGQEISISNVQLKENETIENPYWLKLKRLVALKDMNKNTLNRRTALVFI